MRYYHALIDTKILATGVHYKEMKNVTLIMLSDYDPFKRGRMMYTFERRCLEEPDLEYNDGLRTIYLYAYGTKDVRDEELSEMLKFLADSRRENVTTPEIQEIYGMMNEIKKDSEKGVRYMKSWEIEEMRYNQGKEEGLREGIKKGIDGIIQNMLEAGMEEATIRKMTGCDESTLSRLRNR